jgi:hypothetical protein
MLGREITLPVDLMYGTLPAVPDVCAVEYVEWIRDAAAENFSRAREHLERAAEWQCQVYNKAAVLRTFQRGDWVLRFYPPQANVKLAAKYVRPYLVIDRLGEVTYRIQKDPTIAPIVVHV